MTLAHDFDVAVIGGGYSGTLVTAHLLRHPGATGLRIGLVHDTLRPGRGLAYGTWDDNLVLNVPAGNMSAWDDQPLHFVHHLQRIDPSLHEGSFVARRLYGDYLEQLLQAAQEQSAAQLQPLPVPATELRPIQGGGYRVQLGDGRSVTARQVVLALGHLAPRWPAPWNALPVQTSGLLMPGDQASLQALPTDAPVLVLGTGLTAVDLLFQLTSHAPRQVVLLSRRGLLPQAHRTTPQRPSADNVPAAWMHGPLQVRALLSALRQEARRRTTAGGDWRDAVNALRPHTPALWQKLPSRERARFIRHVSSYWDVHRHRLAPVAAHRLATLRQAGQAQVLAGRVISVKASPGGFQVEWQPRGVHDKQTLKVAAVVNATGPNTDLAQAQHPLAQQMLAEGLVASDSLQLGMNVGPHLEVLNAQGTALPGLFYVGPWLRATRWEATAVPELRQHVRLVAERALESIKASS